MSWDIETNPGPFTNKKKRAERKMNYFVKKENILVQRKESYSKNLQKEESH